MKYYYSVIAKKVAEGEEETDIKVQGICIGRQPEIEGLVKKIIEIGLSEVNSRDVIKVEVEY